MITTIREAIPKAIECINKAHQNDSVAQVLPFNKHRHYLLITHGGLKYWLLYKRAFFNSFGKIFDYKGVGESINVEWVARAIEKDICAFVFVYQKGYVYIVPPNEFRDFGRRNQTIRTTKSGEKTVSVPVSFLRRWKVK